jgi:PAS domain S-box-containing protein
MPIIPKKHNLIFGIAIAVAGAGATTLIQSIAPAAPEALLVVMCGLIVLGANLWGGFASGLLTGVLLAAVCVSRLARGGMNSADMLTLLLFLSQAIGITLVVKKFHDTEDLVTGVLKSIVDPFIIFDETWKCVYANAQAEELFGRNMKELVGKNIREVLPDTIKNPMYSKVIEAVSNNRHVHHVYYSKSVDRWVDANLYPSTRGLAVLFMDLTHQKTIERKLEESELAFNKLIDSNIIGVAIEDMKGNVVRYANSVYLNLTGYTRQDLEKGLLTWERVTPPQYRKKDEAVRKLLLKNGSVKPYEKEYIQKNGNRITALKGAALLDRKNKTSVVFALDISKRSEREKRKDEFLSIASHEMKTPITSIKGFAQLLMRRFEKNGDEKTASYLTRMVNQINRLTYLVNDILDMRKIQDNKLVLNNDFIDINQLVEDAVKEVHLSSPAHAIEWKPTPQPAMAFADYHRIYQALLNILGNAVKYSPATETITVEVADDKEQVTVSVADKGIGIPPAKQKQIFDKFTRAVDKENSGYPGLGIGLFITSEIVKKHGGRIWVKSPTANGKGSTFYFTVPKRQVTN